MTELIRVEDLRVVACGERGEVEIVKGVSFSLEKGEVLALIGESGSGKTTIALALLGYARRGCRLSGGVVQVGEHDMLAFRVCAVTACPISRKARRRRSIRPKG